MYVWGVHCFICPIGKHAVARPPPYAPLALVQLKTRSVSDEPLRFMRPKQQRRSANVNWQ